MTAAFIALSFILAGFAAVSIVLAIRSGIDRSVATKLAVSLSREADKRAEAERRLAAVLAAHDEDARRLELVITQKDEAIARLEKRPAYDIHADPPAVARDLRDRGLLGGPAKGASPAVAAEGVPGGPAASVGADRRTDGR